MSITICIENSSKYKFSLLAKSQAYFFLFGVNVWNANKIFSFKWVSNNSNNVCGKKKLFSIYATELQTHFKVFK